jgi:dimethylargininase
MVVVARESVDPGVFGGLNVVEVPANELYAANTVGRAGRVLVADGFPVTRAALEAAGLDVRALQLSEIARADGSITCLSLRT